MKCACDCCPERVSSEGELCAFCAPNCFPVGPSGARMVLLPADRREIHAAYERLKAARAQTPPPADSRSAPANPPRRSDDDRLLRAAKEAATVLLEESKQELIPGLVRLAKKKIGGLSQ